MTAEMIRQRPPDCKTILRRIRSIEQEALRKRWKWLSMGFVAGLICGSLAMIPLMRQVNWTAERDRWFPKAACDGDLNDGISCGEEILVNDLALEELLGSHANNMTELKQEGAPYASNW
jgi:hypothetical protein